MANTSIKDLFQPAVSPSEITDLELTVYKDLEREVKHKTKMLEDYKDMLKSRGSFSTEKYIVLVKEVTQERLLGLEKVSSVVGREVLESNGLISTSTSKRLSVELKG